MQKYEDYLRVPRIRLGKRLKVIYACTPKCASTSMKNLIKDSYGLPQPTSALPIYENEYWDACGVLYTRQENEESEFFTFTVVRNPFDRLVSCWADRAKRSGQPAYRPYKNYNFNEFARLVMCGRFRMDRHTVPMTWIHTVSDKPLLHRVLRFERLEEDLAELESFLGTTFVPLPRKNCTKHADYRQYYDDDLRTRVSRYYWEDLKNFGYDFDGNYTDHIPWLEQSK